MPGGFRRKRAREQWRVRVDVNGLMRGVVGDAGLADEDLAAFAPRFDAMPIGLERRVGFPVVPGKTDLKRTAQLADDTRGRFDDLVVLANRELARGIRALVDAVPVGAADPDRPALRIHLIDGIDPDRLAMLLGRLDLRRTLFDVVSAAGDALDTMSQFLIVRDRLLQELGAVEYKQHVVITTAVAAGALRQIVNDEGFRDLAFPPDVDDRCAVLTPAALFPAACAGADLGALAAGAADMAARCDTSDVAANPARLLAIALARAQGACTVVAPLRLRALAAWIEHGGTGPHAVPLVLFLTVAERADDDEELPKTYQDLDSIGHLGGQRLATLGELEREGCELALWSVGRPTVTVVAPQVDEYAVGQIVWLVHTAAALARALAEPAADVAAPLAERFAWGLAGRPGYESERAEAQRLAGRKETRYVV